jgi:hypothetical protein
MVDFYEIILAILLQCLPVLSAVSHSYSPNYELRWEGGERGGQGLNRKLSSKPYPVCTAKTQYRKFEANIPRNGIAPPQSQYLIHVSVSYLYIPMIGLPILLQENLWNI